MLKGIRNSLVLTSVLYAALGVVLMIFPAQPCGWPARSSAWSPWAMGSPGC